MDGDHTHTLPDEKEDDDWEPGQATRDDPPPRSPAYDGRWEPDMWDEKGGQEEEGDSEAEEVSEDDNRDNDWEPGQATRDDPPPRSPAYDGRWEPDMWDEKRGQEEEEDSG